MPIVRNLLPDFSPDVKVALWHIEEDVAQLSALCNEAGLNPDKIIDGIRLDKRRIECLAVRLLLCELLPNGDFRLEHAANGAPVNSGHHGNISITHCKDYVAVALSSRNIGVDAEMFTPKVLHVRKHFMSKDELSTIPDDDIRLNTMAWTAKEALYKAIGVDGINFANDPEIDAPALANGQSCYTCRYRNRRFAAHTAAYDNWAFTLAIENE